MPRPSYRCLLSVALVVAAAAFAPGKVRAECGDYLMIGGHHASVHGPAAPAKPAVPCPCRGPHCSQAPDAPVLPPAPAPATSSVDWACLLAAPADAVELPCGRTVNRSPTCPIRHPDPFFHPPRTRA